LVTTSTTDRRTVAPNSDAYNWPLSGGVGRRVVAGALAPEGQRARGTGDEERNRALVRLPRLRVDRRHRVLGLLLQNALADHPRQPADGGISAIEDAHAFTLPRVA